MNFWRAILATALAAGPACAGLSGSFAPLGEKPRELGVKDYGGPESFTEKRRYYMEEYHGLVPSDRLLRLHPMPKIEFKGMTMTGSIASSYREIESLRAGIESFEAEVEELSSAAESGDGDAPNRFLVGQGWRIVKALGEVFNDHLSPAAERLQEASQKGNQNIEVLIMIASGNGLVSIASPRATKIAGTELEAQLIAEVEAEHAQAKATRAEAGPLLASAQGKIGPIYEMIQEYDEAYAEYADGMSLLESGAARTAQSALDGVMSAVATAQRANSSLGQAESAERDAIEAVKKCTQGNLQALNSPGDSGAQANASALNRIALAKVQEADSARQQSNAVIGGEGGGHSVATGSDMEYADRVSYRESDEADKKGVKALAERGARDLDVSGEEAAD